MTPRNARIAELKARIAALDDERTVADVESLIGMGTLAIAGLDESNHKSAA
jgi:hypothetical protein